MCMLTFLPPTVQPSVERLRQGTVSNRDGHGWAIVVPANGRKPARIEYGHGMNADATIESFRLARIIHPDGPALFHSRYTTGGVVDESNCHPYRVCGDSKTLLAHNGVLPWDLDQPAKDRRSDTRYFAEELGPLLYPGISGGYNLNSKRGRRRLRDWLGRGNKFVILTVDPIFKRSHFILNEDQGIWEDDGCWYSNGGYKVRTYGVGTAYKGYGGYPTGGWDYDDWYSSQSPKAGNVWDRIAKATDGTDIIDKGGRLSADASRDCELCQARDTVTDDGWCLACGSCQDCFGDALAAPGSEHGCDCYWPTGTHPGTRKALESVWPPVEEGEESILWQEEGEGSEESDTGWPVTLGPAGGGHLGEGK